MNVDVNRYIKEASCISVTGSHVYGYAGKNSDVDIFMVTNKDTDFIPCDEHDWWVISKKELTTCIHDTKKIPTHRFPTQHIEMMVLGMLHCSQTFVYYEDQIWSEFRQNKHLFLCNRVLDNIILRYSRPLTNYKFGKRIHGRLIGINILIDYLKIGIFSMNRPHEEIKWMLRIKHEEISQEESIKMYYDRLNCLHDSDRQYLNNTDDWVKYCENN